jgi:hypothetical protein
VTAVAPLLLRAFLAARTAGADHGGAVSPAPGGIGLGWLFAVGLVVVVVLAGWAIFAPAAHEPDDEDPSAPPGPPRPD